MKAENQWRGEMFETIYRWVREGKIDAGELDDKVRRILGMKYDYGMFENMCKVDASKAAEPYTDPEVLEVAERAAQRAIMICKDELGALPLDTSKKILLINQQNSIKTPNDIYDHPALFQEMMEKSIPTLQTLEVDFGFNAEDEKTAVAYAEAGSYDLIICTNWYDRSQKPHTYIKELIEKGLPVVLISNEAYCIKENGGLIPSAKTSILNMNLTPTGLDMARRVLLGETEPLGKWPLTNYDPMSLKG
jgi:beta-glucosidase-like glycosyl hydrolase